MTEQEKISLCEKLKKTNLLPLAFIGDSVHTQFVREQVLARHDCKMENYHNQAAKFCKASAQAEVLKRISQILTDEEKEIVRRGRNAKPKHHAKNAESADYAYATAFENRIGYLYLSGQTERLNDILKQSMQVEIDKNHAE